jgi:hypothetical protein
MGIHIFLIIIFSVQIHHPAEGDQMNIISQDTGLHSVIESDNIQNPDPDLARNRMVPVFLVIMGMGISGIWSMDITKGKFKDQGHLFSWKNEAGEFLWTHILAEYLTAGMLIIGGTGLFLDTDWSVSLAMIALGALGYTSLNNLGWTFVKKERKGYAIPMMLGLVGCIISICILF